MTPPENDLRDAVARVGESGKVMPIMLSDEMRRRVRRGERVVHVRNVPWELFGHPCERISEDNHGQSLARIAERGGLHASEAVCILTCVHWREGMVPEDQAHRILYTMTALYRRGALAAEAENTRLRALLVDAGEALRPLAAGANTADADAEAIFYPQARYPDDTTIDPILPSGEMPKLCELGDLRRARSTLAALDKAPTPKEPA